MTSLVPRFPSDAVLLVENNPVHRQQIEQRLARDGITVVTSAAGADEELYNFKAGHPQSHVMIIDLDLGNAKEVNPNQGLDLIRYDLWPFDRTTFFIIFSAYIQREKLIPVRSLAPHWTIIDKEPVKSSAASDNSEGKLTDSCLNGLANVVKECLQLSPARVVAPQHDIRPLLDIIREYESSGDARSLATNERAPLEDAIVRSAQILNHLSQTSDVFRQAGRSAERTALGVYGSVGRLEARSDSDVEFSVFYSRAADPRLSATMWSRTGRAIRDSGLSHEGLGATNNGLLSAKQVGDQTPFNGYMHTIEVESIPSLNLSRQPEHRNRHYQILTELRPVFNADLLADLQRQIVHAQMRSVKTLQNFVTHSYLGDISTQFLLDTAPTTSRDWPWRELKRFYARSLNVLAMRLWLVGQARYRQSALRTEDEWSALFRDLSMPGVIKLMHTSVLISSEDRSSLTTLLSELDRAIKFYLLALTMLTAYSDEESSHESVDSTIPGVSETIHAMRHMVNCLKLMTEHNYFAPVSKCWITATDVFDKRFLGA